MQPLSTSSITVKPQCNEYQLKGEVTIRDKTNGMAKVIFSEELTKQYKKSAFEVFINNKKLIFPAFSNPSSAPRIFFTDSLTITLKLKDGFVKISEVDEKSAKTVFYVNTERCVGDIAYDTYTYIPKEVTLEEASMKMQNLSDVKFEPIMAIYNRHGVAVFGIENEKYALYWANPHEEKVKKMEMEPCERTRNGSTIFAKSRDGAVDFRHTFAGDDLNGEKATVIPGDICCAIFR